jgi:hypothetical protein
MTDNVQIDDLRSALEACGYGWLLDWWGEDVENRLAETAMRLERFMEMYQQRFGDRPDPFSLLAASPAKAAAFFHPTTLAASTEIQCAVWRILLGASVESLQLRYQVGQSPALELMLRTPSGDCESYQTRFPLDVKILRHLGITAVDNDGLVLDGYYAPSSR